MEPIRVLQVVTIMNRGGLETMLMNYYRKIDRSQIQFDFLTHRQERGDYDDEIEALGGKIYRLSSIRPGNYKKYFKELDNFFKYNKYNIVHSHINENSAFVLRAAKKVNIPCRISHNHVAGLRFDYKYPFRKYARYHLKNNINKYFACSEEAAKWLYGKDIFNKERVYLLKNAIDLDNFSYSIEKRNKLKDKMGLQGKFIIGHVGRFNKSKNHDFLVEIFSDIYKKNNNAILLLVGQGELMNRIQKKVFDLGLGESVIFMGLQEDVANIMNIMDVFVFPSYFEALPVVLVEAQANGLTCIVSNGIPREANISGDMQFIDLNQDKQIWVENILNCSTERKNNRNNLCSSGYDINENVIWLTNFYKESNKGG